MKKKKNEVTEWLVWFGGIALDVQRRTIALVEFIIAKAQLLARPRHGINDRQRKALLRMFREGPDGFRGGLSAGNCITITGASPATTTRDLADPVEKGASPAKASASMLGICSTLGRTWSAKLIDTPAELCSPSTQTPNPNSGPTEKSPCGSFQVLTSWWRFRHSAVSY